MTKEDISKLSAVALIWEVITQTKLADFRIFFFSLMWMLPFFGLVLLIRGGQGDLAVEIGTLSPAQKPKYCLSLDFYLRLLKAQNPFLFVTDVNSLCETCLCALKYPVFALKVSTPQGKRLCMVLGIVDIQDLKFSKATFQTFWSPKLNFLPGGLYLFSSHFFTFNLFIKR